MISAMNALVSIYILAKEEEEEEEEEEEDSKDLVSVVATEPSFAREIALFRMLETPTSDYCYCY